MRRLAVVLSLVIMSVILLISGCTKPVYVTMNHGQPSLVELWDNTLQYTGVQNDSVSLQSFNWWMNSSGYMDILYFDFLGKDKDGHIKFYTINLNSAGEIGGYSADWDALYYSGSVLHPMRVFGELDKLDMQSLGRGDKGLVITIDAAVGSGIFKKNENADIYVLYDGELKPLVSVDFYYSTTWAQIMVTKMCTDYNNSYNGETGAISCDKPVPQGERANQFFVFLAQDLLNAETVEYPVSE